MSQVSINVSWALGGNRSKMSLPGSDSFLVLLAPVPG
jgi:hypothetical protein